MRVIKGLRHLKQLPGGSVVTIGVFDGLHIGHREIIRKVVTAARKTKLTSVVITFDPHPMKVLKPRLKVPSLISLKHRIKLIETLGVDILAVVKFTRSFSKISSEKWQVPDETNIPG
jgi:riboflavin kinase/FMN adenylyltransferase